MDLSTGFLSTETSLNDERQYAAAVVIGKEKSSFLYVLGGRGLEDDLDSVERSKCILYIFTILKNINNTYVMNTGGILFLEHGFVCHICLIKERARHRQF